MSIRSRTFDGEDTILDIEIKNPSNETLDVCSMILKALRFYDFGLVCIGLGSLYKLFNGGFSFLPIIFWMNKQHIILIIHFIMAITTEAMFIEKEKLKL